MTKEQRKALRESAVGASDPMLIGSAQWRFRALANPQAVLSLLDRLDRCEEALGHAIAWDENGRCELPPEGKPSLSEICNEALEESP